MLVLLKALLVYEISVQFSQDQLSINPSISLHIVFASCFTNENCYSKLQSLCRTSISSDKMQNLSFLVNLGIITRVIGFAMNQMKDIITQYRHTVPNNQVIFHNVMENSGKCNYFRHFCWKFQEMRLTLCWIISICP